MPVTARLSKAFYDRLGEDIAMELVDLLNLVDETYRAELREANARNFQHFEILLDRRITEVNARLDRLEAEMKSQFAAVLPAVDLRLARDGRRNLVWLVSTLIALFGSQIYFLRR